MWCTEVNHNYMCHICAKGFFRFELIKRLLTNYHVSRNGPTKNGNFKSVMERNRPTASTLTILFQGHVQNAPFYFGQL